MTMRKLREIDFLLNFCDKYLACFTCGVKLNKYRYVQVWKVKADPFDWFLARLQKI